MKITKYCEHEDLGKAMEKNEPMIAVIAFNGETAYMGHIDECMEHHIIC